jgi:hypothetical protein
MRLYTCKRTEKSRPFSLFFLSPLVLFALSNVFHGGVSKAQIFRVFLILRQKKRISCSFSPSIHFVHITVRLCASSSKRTKLRVEKRSGAHKITKAVRKEIFYYLVRSNSRAHLGFIGRERECWEELWESARSKFLEAKKRNCSTFYKPKERNFCRWIFTSGSTRKKP